MQKKKRSALVLSLWVCLALLGGMITYPQAETAYAAAGSVEINAVNFPDNTFRAYIQEKFDSRGNGVLSAAQLQGVTAIDVSGKGISNLTGIELFTALTSLDCSNNALTSLNVSANTKLTNLNCGNNRLAALSLEKNTALTTLRCFENRLANLDISKNTGLVYVDCYENQLMELNIASNTALSYLDCSNNMLLSVDGSANIQNQDDFIFKPQKKRPQTITVPESEILKTLGDAPFSLGANLVGNPAGTLTYSSSDADVATVDSNGMVTLTGIGTTTITIRAAATDQYHAAEATVELTVEPADEDEGQDPGDGSEDEDQDNDQDTDEPSTGEPITQPNPPAVNPTEQGTNPVNGTNPRNPTTKPAKSVAKRTPAATGQKLLTLAVKAGSEKNRLTWPKIKDADGYFIYASKCNEGNKKHGLKKIKTITSGKKTTYIHQGLEKANWYKYRIDAYRIVKGKKEVFEHSLQLHSLTGGSEKYVNPAKVKVAKKNVTLKKGKNALIQAKVILPKGKKTQWHTAQLRYMVSDKTVVSVSKNGIIKAKKKGKATIYVVTQNGVRGKVIVKVK